MLNSLYDIIIAGKRPTKGLSLRKKIAKKQLLANLVVSNGEEDKGTTDELDTNDIKGFPALPENGRISLVSSASDFIRNTRTKDIDRVFSGKGFRL